jgi:hypothetical protein
MASTAHAIAGGARGSRAVHTLQIDASNEANRMRSKTAARGATLFEILVAICFLLSAGCLLFQGIGVGAVGLAADVVECLVQRIGGGPALAQGCGAGRSESLLAAAGDYESPEEPVSEKHIPVRAGKWSLMRPAEDSFMPIADLPQLPLRELPSWTDPRPRSPRTPERSVPPRQVLPKAIPRPERRSEPIQLRDPVAISLPERGERVPLPERPPVAIPLPESGERVPLPERGERVPLPVRSPVATSPGPKDGPQIGYGHFTVTDFGVDLNKAGLRDKIAQKVGLIGGYVTEGVCHLIIRWKGGCAAFGTGSGLSLYAFSELVIPDSLRFRNSHGIGCIRPKECNVDYRLVSFGLARRSDWKGTKHMTLRQALTLLATTLVAVDNAGMPLSVAAAVFSPGLDWEYDVACTNKSLETGICHIGTRVSWLTEAWGATGKGTAAIQTPETLPRALIERFMSDDPRVKAEAYVEIALSNLFNQPMKETLKLSAISLNLYDAPVSSVAPKGGFAYQRVGTTPISVSKEWNNAKVGMGALVQVGKTTLDTGEQFLAVRLLNTFTGEVGAISVKPQKGPHFIVPIGSEGQPVDVSGVITLLSDQKAMGELGPVGREQLAYSLRTGMAAGDLNVDPAGREKLDAALAGINAEAPQKGPDAE